MLVAVLAAGCGSGVVIPQRQSSFSKDSTTENEDRNLLERAMEDVQHPERWNRTSINLSEEEIARLALEQWKREQGHWETTLDPTFSGPGVTNRDDREVQAEKLTQIVNRIRSQRRALLVFKNEETLNNVVDSLNQWSQAVSPKTQATTKTPAPGNQASPQNSQPNSGEDLAATGAVDWEQIPFWLWQTLPEDIRSDPQVVGIYDRLDSMEFRRSESERSFYPTHDGWRLQEAVWLRDASEAAVLAPRPLEPLEKINRLFDWVIRNIRLIPGSPDDYGDLETEVLQADNQTRTVKRPTLLTPPMEAWRILLTGRGHAEYRSWVFTLLLRQQGFSAVMLGYQDPQNLGEVRPWLPAVVHQGELYLYEPTLGTPVPGPQGQGVATLSQVRKDPSLLKALELPGQDYPVGPEQLEGLVGLIEASPVYLMKRMKVIQESLPAEDQLVLWVNTAKLAAQLKSLGLTEVRLWDRHYRDLRYFTLSRAKGLQLRGPAWRVDFDRKRQLLAFVGLPRLGGMLEDKDTAADELAPIPTSELWNARVMQLKGIYSVDAQNPEVDLRKKALNLPPQDQRLRYDTRQGSVQLYIEASRTVSALLRQAQRYLRRPELTDRETDQAEVVQGLALRVKEQIPLWRAVLKIDWGLATGDRDRLRSAINDLHTVIASSTTADDVSAARFLLGRVLERLGQIDQAVAIYQADNSPACLWRAARLTRPASAEVSFR